MNSEPELHSNPRKTSTIRRLGIVDIGRLREAVLAIPETVWNVEDADKPNRFGALDMTRHIVFRFVSNFLDWRDSYERPLWAEWRPLVVPILTVATAEYGYARGSFPRVMLARMAPGGVIHPHRAENPAAKWPHKIHVPTQTNGTLPALPVRKAASDSATAPSRIARAFSAIRSIA